MKSLDSMKNSLLLDYFLSNHVKHLYREIRMRSLQQYLQPFVIAKISTMAESFNTRFENDFENKKYQDTGMKVTVFLALRAIFKQMFY